MGKGRSEGPGDIKELRREEASRAKALRQRGPGTSTTNPSGQWLKREGSCDPGESLGWGRTVSRRTLMVFVDGIKKFPQSHLCRDLCSFLNTVREPGLESQVEAACSDCPAAWVF